MASGLGRQPSFRFRLCSLLPVCRVCALCACLFFASLPTTKVSERKEKPRPFLFFCLLAGVHPTRGTLKKSARQNKRATRKERQMKASYCARFLFFCPPLPQMVSFFCSMHGRSCRLCRSASGASFSFFFPLRSPRRGRTADKKVRVFASTFSSRAALTTTIVFFSLSADSLLFSLGIVGLLSALYACVGPWHHAHHKSFSLFSFLQSPERNKEKKGETHDDKGEGRF